LIVFLLGLEFLYYSSIPAQLANENMKLREYKALQTEYLEHVPTSKTCCFSDILLVINFNTPGYARKVIPKLRKMYSPSFPKIVFYSQEYSLDVEFCDETTMRRNYSEHVNGAFSYLCLALAMEKYPGYEGYLFVQDDLVWNFWNTVNWDRNKTWTFNTSDVVDIKGAIPTNWVWWRPSWPSLHAVFQEFSKEDIDRIEKRFNYTTAFVGCWR
jgi:hypothetical protein